MILKKRTPPVVQVSPPAPVITTSQPVQVASHPATMLKKARPQQFKPSEVKQDIRVWETEPILLESSIGCCGYHMLCMPAGDCVKKAFHPDYATMCSLYKNIRKGV